MLTEYVSHRWDSTGTLAKNSIWYQLSTGKILETDIKFNTDYAFKTDGAADAYDVQNIATHELGHSLALADLYESSDSDKTMYGYAAKGETKKRTLTQDDMDGITYLYPSGAWGPGTQRWVFPTGDGVFSSPAMGWDGTIYVGSYDKNLYAINPDGTQKWAFPTGGYILSSSPAIGSDGSIYVGSYDFNLYAINPDGSQKWVFPTGDAVNSSPAIGTDGTIFVGSLDDNLYAINPDGSQKWAFPTGGGVRSSPAIGPDGIIYAGSFDKNLYAINPDGTQKWVFPTGNILVSSPAIASNGILYVGSYDFNLYAINPDGTRKWVFPTKYFIDSSPAIGPDGTIYVGSEDKNLYAINPDGTQKWAFQTGNPVKSSPAIGADGTIYIGSYKNLYAINPDGTQKWAFQTGDSVDSSPAIGSDGTIYVGSRDSNLYAVYGNSGGLANSDWPMFHHDLRHAGVGSFFPAPDIKANGCNGSITVSPNTPVFISISLNASYFDAQNADWWVVELTPSGDINYFELSTGSMVPGFLPTYQGPLFDFGSTQILNASDLTAGTHIFCFGVDLDMNGSLNTDTLFYDFVTVSVANQ